MASDNMTSVVGQTEANSSKLMGIFVINGTKTTNTLVHCKESSTLEDIFSYHHADLVLEQVCIAETIPALASRPSTGIWPTELALGDLGLPSVEAKETLRDILAFNANTRYLVYKAQQDNIPDNVTIVEADRDERPSSTNVSTSSSSGGPVSNAFEVLMESTNVNKHSQSIEEKNPKKTNYTIALLTLTFASAL